MAFAGYRYHQRTADDEGYPELTGQALQATGGVHGVTNRLSGLEVSSRLFAAVHLDLVRDLLAFL
jgi:hypothetical protein